MMDRSDRFFETGGFDAAGGTLGGRGGEPQAFAPRPIDPADVALANRLSLRRMPVAIELGDAAIAFTPVGLGSIDVAAPPDQLVTFKLEIDGRPLALQMAKGLYARMLERIDPVLLAAELDEDILPLLLEACIEDELRAAETLLQGRITLVAIETGSRVDLDGPEVAIEISIDGRRAGRGSLRAARRDVERLADLFQARSKPPRCYGDLQVELRFRAGAIWLDLGALKTLKTGDVLLVEEVAARWERMAATVGEHWLFPIEVTRAGPTVRAPFRRADRKDQEEWMMVEHSQTHDDNGDLSGPSQEGPGGDGGRGPTPSPEMPEGSGAAGEGEQPPIGEGDLDAGPASPPADAAFDDLPIKLVFELGRLELPLGELQEIGPGHVFELQRPLGEGVEIHAGGRRIGQGEIIKIDDQIGVRLTRLFGQSGA